MESLLSTAANFITPGLGTAISGGLGFLGGLFNTSSQQSINAANLAEQQWSAQGGYLPGLVRNANKAGLNPLAVLGQRGPDMAVQTGTQAGSAFSNLGRSLQDYFNNELVTAQAKKVRQDEATSKASGDLATAQAVRTLHETDRSDFELEQMKETARRHPEWTYGMERPPMASEWFSKFWNNPWRLDWKLDQ